jgi:hypothetical protein
VAWRRKLEALLLEEEDGRPLSAAMQDLLRESVQATISDLSAASAQAVRDGLVRELAGSSNLEHLLWRDDAAPRHADGVTGASKQNLIHRYLEALWSHAKPAANYDVADRLAAHGIPVDFAAVWGSPESDLSETTLREFRSTLLPTDDPFRINFVRPRSHPGGSGQHPPLLYGNDDAERRQPGSTRPGGSAASSALWGGGRCPRERARNERICKHGLKKHGSEKSVFLPIRVYNPL